MSNPFFDIKTLLHADNLRAKCARSGVILGIAVCFERGIRFIRNMLLARLLAREDFGLMAIIFVVAQLLEASTEAGVKPAIIQDKHGEKPEYLNVAWWFQAVRGMSLFAIAFLIAPLICQFYKTPEILGWLRFSFLAIVFNGLLSPRAYALEKQFRFGKVAFLMQGGSFLGVILTIILAFILRDVSALVIGYVAEPALRTLLSYILCPFYPSFKIDRDKLRNLLTFSHGAIGLPLFTCIALNAHTLFLGRMVTKAELGMFYLASSFMQLPIDLFRNVVGTFLLPAFVAKQDDLMGLYKGLLEITKITAMLCIPFIAFLVVCASSVLSVVYGVRYSAVAVPFALLSCHILTRIQGSVLGLVFLAVGKPHLQRRCALIRLITVFTLMYPAILLFRLPGAALAILISGLLAQAAQIILMRKVVRLKIFDYARCYLLGSGLAVIVLIPTVLLKQMQIESLIINIGVGSLFCFLAYLVGVFLLKHNNNKVINGLRFEEKR